MRGIGSRRAASRGMAAVLAVLTGCGGVSNFGPSEGGVYVTCPSGGAWDVAALFWSAPRCDASTTPLDADTACAALVARNACASSTFAKEFVIEDARSDTFAFRARLDSIGVTADVPVNEGQRAFCFGDNGAPWDQDLPYRGTIDTSPSGDAWSTRVDFTNVDPLRQAPIRGDVAFTACDPAAAAPVDDTDAGS